MEQKNPLKIPKILWFQLFLLAIGYAFYSANRLSFGVGLKAVAASLSLTAVQLGTIGTIFTLGQALIDIPAGYLADRFGRKRMLIFGMVGLGCMTACVTTQLASSERLSGVSALVSSKDAGTSSCTRWPAQSSQLRALCSTDS